MPHANEIKPKKLLIITSSGGGGLLQTANAKQQEILAKDPNVIIVRRDVLKDWLWKPFGKFCINFWNRAQLRGNIPLQVFCVYAQLVFDFFLHPVFFFYAASTIFKEDVDYIIDTQNMGTSAILKALGLFNRKKGKNVRLEKVLVDLPTKKAIHFFLPIKKLSKKNRKWLSLTSIPPLLEEGETAAQFWQKNCGLSEAEVNCEDVYVRQAFQKYKKKGKADEKMHIKVRYKNQEELNLMKKTFERGEIQAKASEHEVDFCIAPEDRMVTILLGSQPAGDATFKYVKEWIEVAKQFPDQKIVLFAFCSDHKEGEKSLMWRVSQWVTETQEYPKNLSVVPFSFQNESVIAPLFYRADITCTRSGGQTAMELMCVSTGEIWIHSEAKKGKHVLSGISGWEAGSAVYMQKMHGAKIVTPDLFTHHVGRILQRDSGRAAAMNGRESLA